MPSRCRRPAARRIARPPSRARSSARRRTRPIAARRTGTATPADCAAGPAARRRTGRVSRRSPIRRIMRGRRISRTMVCCTSLPPPNSASITVSGDSRTGPVPSEPSASNAASTASAGGHDQSDVVGNSASPCGVESCIRGGTGGAEVENLLIVLVQDVLAARKHLPGSCRSCTRYRDRRGYRHRPDWSGRRC